LSVEILEYMIPFTGSHIGRHLCFSVLVSSWCRMTYHPCIVVLLLKLTNVLQYPWVREKLDIRLLPITSPNVEDFRNSFAIRLNSKTRNETVIKDFHHSSNASLHYLVKGKCQETTDNLKQMSRLRINFNLFYYS